MWKLQGVIPEKNTPQKQAGTHSKAYKVGVSSRSLQMGLYIGAPINGRKYMGFTGIISPRNKWEKFGAPTYN